ncbi:hypothetical protein JCGZ_21353 [Jatropha curcas]|uniref:Uncharacterized protein n=1 Tax=Jatropha curcas TaxID=180498 RepID=A0A067JAT9_JATCU|nr:uncharacterized protein LOC105649457 [Jatropha curcas]KDP20882.1 hypothetical protein JCGZ_21353 [Jatropha curcas]
MEGNGTPWGLNSVSVLVPVEIMNTVPSKTFSYFSSDPLCSCIITLSTLILLYFPHALKVLLPVLILTVLLLLFLLRLGAIQRVHTRNLEEIENEETAEIKENRDDNFDKAEKSVFLANVDKWVACHAKANFDPNPKSNFEETFVGWNVRAPLEVIYEAYEGEEEDKEDSNEKNQDFDPAGSLSLERYPSLSMYYPETDSDSSSDGNLPMNGGWDSPESVCFRWEEEDRAGLLIEIALGNNNRKHSCFDFQAEEDNLIEIDISPPRNDAFR